MYEVQTEYDPITDSILTVVAIVAPVVAYAAGWFLVDAGAEALANLWGVI